MKKFTLFSCALISVSLTAQVTLTQSDFPVAGNTYVLQLSDTAGVVAGASGTGANWNFSNSNSNIGTMVDSFKTVLSTPYGATYPQANLALHEISPTVNYFVYFNETGSSVSRVGNADPVNVITYSNPATQYVFPLSYGTTANDTYSASYVDASSGSTVHVHGSGTSNADALGTIVLPSGTYSNVLRVHYTRTETDTIFTTSSGSFPLHLTDDFYLWYQSGLYYPVFHLENSTTQVASGPITHKKVVGWRTGNASAGINETADSDINIFPNPASSIIHIQSQQNTTPVTISLFDATGKLVRSIETVSENAELQVSDLTNGVYFLFVNFGNGKSETKKILIYN